MEKLKVLLKLMIWGYHHFRKPPYLFAGDPSTLGRSKLPTSIPEDQNLVVRADRQPQEVETMVQMTETGFLPACAKDLISVF